MQSRYWNVTPEERAAHYPCQDHAVEPYATYLRATDVDASPAVLFRWVCQVKVAPYSYDWLDNLGRTSPRTLTPGADDLAVGQLLMIARIVDFEVGRHITAVGTPAANRIFGPLTMTYQVRPRGAGHSRLVACLTVGASTPAGRLRRGLLGWGDLVMMRKQLLTLRSRAEETAGATVTAPRRVG